MTTAVHEMSWGFYMQGSDQQIEVEELGSKLSVAISCPVHYPAYGKGLYECKHGVIFPLYVVKGQNWAMLQHKHEVEKKLISDLEY